MPFEAHYLDVVTCIALLEHVFDIYHVIEEISRVTRKGEVLISAVPNIAYLKHRLGLLVGRLPVTSIPYNWPEVGWDGGQIHYFNKATLTEFLGQLGFRVTKVKGSGFLAQISGLWPSLLSGDLIVQSVKESDAAGGDGNSVLLSLAGSNGEGCHLGTLTTRRVADAILTKPQYGITARRPPHLAGILN